jgi:excisionase family DNA binding protein
MTGAIVNDGDGMPSYRWISPSRAADLLGTSLRHVYRLIDHGHLPGYRIDGEVRLLMHEVDEFRQQMPDGDDAL